MILPKKKHDEKLLEFIVQIKSCYIAHELEQPSPETLFPSSHASFLATPSPHVSSHTL